MGRDEMRAGDSDREAVADALKQALEEGRLDLAEYDERLQKAYLAKTYRDLNGLLDDLPGADVPAPSHVGSEVTPQPEASPVPSSHGRPVQVWLGGFGGVFVVCTVIWLVSSLAAGHGQYFWPVWLLIPMVFGAMGRLGRGRHNH